MTIHEIWKAPYRSDYGLYIFDSNNQMLCDVLDYGDEELIDNIVSKLNGDASIHFDDKFTYDIDKIICYDERPVLEMRGWDIL